MDILQAIENRRSINYFDPARPIPADTLTALLETANLAPSSMNLQPWRVIVVTDPGRKTALRQCAFNQPKVEEASVMLIMIADPTAVETNIDRVLDSWIDLGFLKPEMRETYQGLAAGLYDTPDSLRRKFFAVKNASLYAMTLMIAAQGLGLETHPMDGFDEAAVKNEFGIPDACIVPMLIAVGYLKPGVTLLPRAFRRELSEFVSIDTFANRF